MFGFVCVRCFVHARALSCLFKFVCVALWFHDMLCWFCCFILLVVRSHVVFGLAVLFGLLVCVVLCLFAFALLCVSFVCLLFVFVLC